MLTVKFQQYKKIFKIRSRKKNCKISNYISYRCKIAANSFGKRSYNSNEDFELKVFLNQRKFNLIYRIRNANSFNLC